MIPKTQKEYFELSHKDRSKVSKETLLKLLDEDTTEIDPKADYYPLSEAFDAMSAEDRAGMSKEDKLLILNEIPQKRQKED